MSLLKTLLNCLTILCFIFPLFSTLVLYVRVVSNGVYVQEENALPPSLFANDSSQKVDSIILKVTKANCSILKLLFNLLAEICLLWNIPCSYGWYCNSAPIWYSYLFCFFFLFYTGASLNFLLIKSYNSSVISSYFEPVLTYSSLYTLLTCI